MLIAFIAVVLLLLVSVGFGAWAFISRQDYKDNVETKIAAAVGIAQKQTATAKDNEFLEKEKLPLKYYKGPGTYGSVQISYPKTWSAFVTELSTSGGTPVEGYFHPNFVPSISQQTGTGFALRVQVVSTAYDQVLRQFENNAKTGKVKITAYSASKVPGTVGARVDGEIVSGKQGSMVLFPIRDKTLKVWTEATQFVGDFDSNILPNLSFVP